MCVLWPQWKHSLRQFLQVPVAGSPTSSLKHVPMKVFHLPVKVFPFPVSWSCSIMLLQSQAADSGSGTSFMCRVWTGRPSDPSAPVYFGSDGQGHTLSPLQGLAVLSFIHELRCCQSKRCKALHPKAKCARGCLHTAAWHGPRFAGVTARGSPASWPGIYCCLFDWACLQF